jgi:ABC-type amino acid transport substrate-binding protein
MSVQRRFLSVTILAFSMALLGLLPSSAAQDDAALSASDTASTVRTAKGDLVIGDMAAFAQALEEIGSDGEVIVWLRPLDPD